MRNARRGDQGSTHVCVVSAANLKRWESAIEFAAFYASTDDEVVIAPCMIASIASAWMELDFGRRSGSGINASRETVPAVAFQTVTSSTLKDRVSPGGRGISDQLELEKIPRFL